jgi:hypothetical protein
VEFVDGGIEVEFAPGDAFHEAIDFPEQAEVVIGGLDAFDVNELVEFVVLPEGAGEGGGADEEAAVEAELAGDVDEVAFDALAGCAAFMEGDSKLHDEAGFAAVIVGRGVQTRWGHAEVLGG